MFLGTYWSQTKQCDMQLCTTKIGLMQNSFFHILAKIEKKRQNIRVEIQILYSGPT
jgi:hypothetical protein